MSENSDNKPLATNQNVKWYKLGGKSKDAILRSIELNNKDAKVSKTELKELRGTLGIAFRVARTDAYHGYSAHAPEVFVSPYPNEENQFYIMCPIGDGRKDGETYFTPEGAIELSEKEIETLSLGLFAPHGGAIPILRVEPIALQKSQDEPDNNPS